MCRLVDEFEIMRSKFYGDKAKPVKFIVKALGNKEGGIVSPEVAAILEDCEEQIFSYFVKRDL